jgi:hypothetical protein
MFQTKVVAKIKTRTACSVTFFENHAVYGLMLKNVIEPDRLQDDNIIWRMRIACYMTKGTDAHSEYVILIAFPRQQWLSERTSMLGHT